MIRFLVIILMKPNKYLEIIVSHTLRIAMIISTFGKVSVRD
jgi:hypothetical protein